MDDRCEWTGLGGAFGGRHVGAVSESAREAWQILFDDVFVQVPRTLGILPGYRPKLGDNYNKLTSNENDNATLLLV